MNQVVMMITVMMKWQFDGTALIFIVLQPPLERPDAVIYEDSNYEDTGDADRLPRRILNAAAEFSNLNRSGKTPTYLLRKFSKSPTRTAKTL